MSATMSRAEEEAFLSEVRIGVLGVDRPDGPPSLTPIWYRYAGGVVEMVTTGSTAKVELLRATGQASLCVQREEGQPAFVTVEGDVTVSASTPELVEAIAGRYLGPEGGAEFAAGQGRHDDTLLTLRVRTWRSIDFAKLQG